MKFLFLVPILVIHCTPLSDYANCLWTNCKDLRTTCGMDCVETAEVINIKQSSEYCVTGNDRILYYKTCAGLIANATTGNI